MSQRIQDPRTHRPPVTAASLRTELLVDAAALLATIAFLVAALL